MKRYFTLIGMVVGFLAFPFVGRAATTLYFEAATGSVSVGSAFPVRILLDTDQPVNAYTMHVRYSSNILGLQDTNNASSIITVWQGDPAVLAGGEIAVNGGSLTAFTGKHGQLLQIDFVPSATGTATLSFIGPAVYLANGKGTKVIPQTKNLQVVVSGTAGASPSPAAASAKPEIIPPVIQYLAMIQDPFNGNQKLLAFLASDSGSGVSGTEIRYRTGLSWSPWQAVTNPAPLPKGVWEVDFRTVDHAGNVTEQIVYDWAALTTFALIAGAIGIVIIVAVLFFVLRKK
jgi:hypothetical protein